MNSFLKKIIVLALLFTPLLGLAQDAENKNQPKSSRSQKIAARKKWKQQRKIERNEKKKIKKHHKHIQSKDTYKRMKKDKKKAARINSDKREFFLKRWFKKK